GRSGRAVPPEGVHRANSALSFEGPSRPLKKSCKWVCNHCGLPYNANDPPPGPSKGGGVGRTVGTVQGFTLSHSSNAVRASKPRAKSLTVLSVVLGSGCGVGLSVFGTSPGSQMQLVSPQPHGIQSPPCVTVWPAYATEAKGR